MSGPAELAPTIVRGSGPLPRSRTTVQFISGTTVARAARAVDCGRTSGNSSCFLFQMSLKVLAPAIRGVLHPRTVLSAQAIVGSSSAARPRARRRYEPIAQIGRGGMAEVLLTMADAGGGVWRLEVLKKIWPE